MVYPQKARHRMLRLRIVAPSNHSSDLVRPDTGHSGNLSPGVTLVCKPENQFIPNNNKRMIFVPGPIKGRGRLD